MLRKDRTDRRGGGVAICYKSDSIEMNKVKIKRSKFEILAAIGRRTGQRRKILVVAAYLPPSYNAEDLSDCLNEINDTLLLLMRRYDNPYVIVAGDFNKRDARRATADSPEIKQIATPPTRGTNVLDIIMSSFNHSLIDCGVTSPIACVEGVETDHKTVFAKFRMPRVPSYEVQEYEYYHITEKACAKFATWARDNDWKAVYEADTPDQKVKAMEDQIGMGMKACFEKKYRKRKTTEPPWITEEIRQWITRRRAIFKRCGRNAAWKKLKRGRRPQLRRERSPAGKIPIRQRK